MRVGVESSLVRGDYGQEICFCFRFDMDCLAKNCETAA